RHGRWHHVNTPSAGPGPRPTGVTPAAGKSRERGTRLVAGPPRVGPCPAGHDTAGQRPGQPTGGKQRRMRRHVAVQLHARPAGTGAEPGVLVRKYGGSSVADDACLRRVARSVAAAHRAGSPTVVVVSAQGDTTDDLLQRAAAVGAPPASREVDQLLGTGAIASAALLALALRALRVPATPLT